jgi:cytochrome c oxidase assembly protein subunit 15
MNSSRAPSNLDSSPKSHSSESQSLGLHFFAVLTAATTLPLIFIGGLVTSHDAALAVPDWPTSYGYNMFLFPWHKMVGGIFYEHSHRLMGSLVGILSIALCVWLYWKEKRVWVKKLGGIALAAIIIQGTLGGLRVELVFKPIAIVHACLAQLIFCLTAAIALFTSPFWKRLELNQFSKLSDTCLKKAALITTSIIFIQLILGAVMRHTNSGLAIPDFPKMYGHWLLPLDANSIEQMNQDRVWKWNLDRIELSQILIHLAHRIWATIVSISIIALFFRIRKNHRDCKPLTRLSGILVSFLIIQLLLGMSVIWSQKAADIATAHVAVGALTLVTSVLLTLVTFKLVAPNPGSASISVASKEAVA